MRMAKPSSRRGAPHCVTHGAYALTIALLLAPACLCAAPNSAGFETGLPTCNVDSDCSAGSWCSKTSGLCTSKFTNGSSLPVDPGHFPILDGECRPSAAVAVCLSGVCDTHNNTCGYLNGDGPCTPGPNGNGTTICDSGYCSPTLLVCESGPNRFSIVAADQWVNQGGSATVTVSTTVTSGLAESISLAASGFPDGVSGQFDPVSVTAGDSSTLTLSADPTAVPGMTTQITVSGSATSDSESATFNLTVWDYVFRDGFE